MGQFYWHLEYVKVFLAYGAAFYLWPAVVFYPHLKGRSIAYRFAFSTLISVVLLSTVVSFLGIAHLLYSAVVAVLYYGVFFLQLIRNFHPFQILRRDAIRLHHKTMTWKQLLVNGGGCLGKKSKAVLTVLWKNTAGNRLKYVMLAVVLIFGTLYFSYGALQLHSFGCGDQYVHHTWIHALMQGQIYPDGVYPEGMHCMIYVLSVLFGVSTYSINLFLAGVHIHATFLTAYLMMKELFHCKYTPIIVLTGFLTINHISDAVISAVVRLSWTLPQEFAFPAVFLCAYSLLRFLKEEQPQTEGKWYRHLSLRAFLEDENLHIFILSIAVTITVHFYATIIAFFICIVIFIVDMVRIFNWKKFLKLGLAGIVALVISIAPMAAALAAGYPFQGSIHWAIAVTKGGQEAWANGEYNPQEDYLKKRNTKNENEAASQTGDASGRKESEDSDQTEASSVLHRPSLLDRIKSSVLPALSDLYQGTFGELYPGIRGQILFWATVMLGGTGLLGSILLAIMNRIEKKNGWEDSQPGQGFTCSGYVTIALVLASLTLEFQPNLIGLPIVIAGNRLCAVQMLFAVMVYCSFLDFLLFLIGLEMREEAMSILSVGFCVGVYLLMQATGIFHSFLYHELTRYPSTVEMTERIVSVMPKDMYTIVSNTEEYYQVVETGFHEEVTDFTNQWKDEAFTIPTPYVFLYIEKQPLYYSQLCFYSGPSWLAWQNYPKYYRMYHEHISQYPDVLKGSISESLVNAETKKVSKRADLASNLENREILESKMYAWLERFRRVYPNEGFIAYEDEDFLCYYIQQNPNTLLTLGIMGG